MWRIDPRQALVVLVDVQEKLWAFMQERDHVGRALDQLVEIAGLLEIPIVMTEQYSKGLGPTVPELRSRLEKWSAYRPIEKKAFSCFGEPRFIETVSGLGRKTLVVCGIETHVCVMQTVLDGIESGYRVHLVSDAVSSRFASSRAAGIGRMQAAGAVLTTVEMLAFEAMATAGHPKFRDVQRVIL